MTSWCYLDLSSAFDHIPNTLLLYKLSTCKLSDSYVSWLHCYITSGYSFVWIHSIYLTPSVVFPRAMSLGSTYLICFLMILAVLLSTQNIFLSADTIKIARSIRSATDDTYAIWKILCMFGVLLTMWNLILIKLESVPLQVKCWLHILPVNQKLGLIPTLTYSSSTTSCSFLLYFVILHPS